MDEGRLTMASELVPCPSCVHVAPPSVDCHNPCLAMPAMILSWPGTADMKLKFPHSDGIPARFAVTFIHWAESGKTKKSCAMSNEWMRRLNMDAILGWRAIRVNARFGRLRISHPPSPL